MVCKITPIYVDRRAGNFSYSIEDKRKICEILVYKIVIYINRKVLEWLAIYAYVFFSMYTSTSDSKWVVHIFITRIGILRPVNISMELALYASKTVGIRYRNILLNPLY